MRPKATHEALGLKLLVYEGLIVNTALIQHTHASPPPSHPLSLTPHSPQTECGGCAAPYFTDLVPNLPLMQEAASLSESSAKQPAFSSL
jgi:hypothetical protein